MPKLICLKIKFKGMAKCLTGVGVNRKFLFLPFCSLDHY
jgi:hypothetical protein